MAKRKGKLRVVTAKDWAGLVEHVESARGLLDAHGEVCWFRGCPDTTFTLQPSLMRRTQHLTNVDHDDFERDVFFEFQARAAKLRRLSLSDWDYLFYSRHHHAPTRVLDWTDALGVALFFALDEWKQGQTPAIWVMNPYSLNEANWDLREIVLPKYLGYDEEIDDYWEFGELLAGGEDWSWIHPVAVYPMQYSERVTAQRGWFTVHGENRAPLDEQSPEHILKIELSEHCALEAARLLDVLGIDKASIYQDLDSLARSVEKRLVDWAASRGQVQSKSGRGKPRQRRAKRSTR